ncbi:MAG: response regulator [Melioribacteraceae bacterium]
MRPKLLIVEDDDLTLKVYQFVLSKDYELTECKNESELLDALNEGEYDIFIIDLSLIEGKNGIDIIKELRQMKKYQRVKIIVVTAHAAQVDERNAIEAGADEFLRKPISNQDLKNALKHHTAVRDN